jgi:hypothetical protein
MLSQHKKRKKWRNFFNICFYIFASLKNKSSPLFFLYTVYTYDECEAALGLPRSFLREPNRLFVYTLLMFYQFVRFVSSF